MIGCHACRCTGLIETQIVVGRNSKSHDCYSSIGRDTKFTVFHFVCMYDYGFLSRGFTDRREILHGGPA